MQKKRRQRAKYIEFLGHRENAGSNVDIKFTLFFVVILALSGVIMAKPAPSPTISSQQNIRLPLWQSSLSMSSLQAGSFGRRGGALLGIAGASSDISQKRISLHHFDMPCQSCHDPSNTTDESKMSGGSIWKMSTDVNNACSSSGCHDYNATLDHPVGVTASGITASDLPLDDYSRITCLTCHLEPDSSIGSKVDDTEQEAMLRLPDESDLCGSCHLQMAETMGKSSHWRFSDKAHLGSIGSQSNQTKQQVYFAGGIDSESRTCLSCHEDISVTIPSYNESHSQKKSRWGQMSDHPIGMDYSRVALQKMGKYNYPIMNNDNIRLFDGKVGCGSCHSPYSKEKNNLVQSNYRSALCFQCHNM